MQFDVAIRMTEILLALAFIQQSCEHLVGERRERMIGAARLGASLFLLAGVLVPWACAALVGLAFANLYRFQGPYNGGSDRMGILILFCLTGSHVLPGHQMQELAFGYLAVQLVMSYVISGWVKIVNPEWRRGQALQDVFRFSAYPVSEELRGWADRPRLLFAMSWAVMGFELIFPLALFTPVTLIAALCIAMVFHGANACLFGLNRFLWTWIAAYPSLIWLQSRLFVGG